MKLLGLLLILSFAVTGCQLNEKQLAEALKKNPALITDAIKSNPTEFIEALNEAVTSAQSGQAKKRQEDEKKQLELEVIKTLVKTEMETAFIMDVPLDVEVDTGLNWLEAH